MLGSKELKTSPPIGLPAAYSYFIELIDRPKTWFNKQRWYWRIKHRNGQTIGGAEYYSSNSEREDTVAYFAARHNFPIWHANTRMWLYVPAVAFNPYTDGTSPNSVPIGK